MSGGRGPFASIATVGLTAFVAACVPPNGGWDLRALEARHPALEAAALRGHRLGDLAPHFAPDVLFGPADARGDVPTGLRFFACRFDTSAPVGWQTEGDLDDRRAAETARAMRAVAEAVPGLDLREADEGASLRLRIGADELPGRTGRATSDCRLSIGGESNAAPEDGTVAARVVRGELRLRSVRADALGRPQRLSSEEFLGALVHEVAHALGFSSHTATRDDPLAKAVDGARWAGRRLARGETLAFPTLAALYAIPNGAVVGRGDMVPASARAVAELVRVAHARGWDGPFSRVGDRAGELFWTDAEGRRYALWAPRPEAAWPDPLVLVPNRAARRAIAASAGEEISRD